MTNMRLLTILFCLLLAASVGAVSLTKRFPVVLQAKSEGNVHIVMFDDGDSSLFRASLSDGKDLVFVLKSDTLTQIDHCTAKWDTFSTAADSGIGIVYIDFPSAIATTDTVFCYVGAEVTESYSRCDSVGSQRLIARDHNGVTVNQPGTPLHFSALTRCNDMAVASVRDYSAPADNDWDHAIRENGTVFHSDSLPDSMQWIAFFSGRDTSKICGGISATNIGFMYSETGLPNSWTLYPDSVTDKHAEDCDVVEIDSGWAMLTECRCDADGVSGEIGIYFCETADICTNFVFQGIVIDSAAGRGGPSSPAWLWEWDEDTAFVYWEDAEGTNDGSQSLSWVLKDSIFIPAGWHHEGPVLVGSDDEDQWDYFQPCSDWAGVVNDTIVFIYHIWDVGGSAVRVAATTTTDPRVLAHPNNPIQILQQNATLSLYPTIMPFQVGDEWYAMAYTSSSDGLDQLRFFQYDSTEVPDGWTMERRGYGSQVDVTEYQYPLLEISDDKMRLSSPFIGENYSCAALETADSMLTTDFTIEVFQQCYGNGTTGQLYTVAAGKSLVDTSGGTSLWSRPALTAGYAWNVQTNKTMILEIPASGGYTQRSQNYAGQTSFDSTQLVAYTYVNQSGSYRVRVYKDNTYDATNWTQITESDWNANVKKAAIIPSSTSTVNTVMDIAFVMIRDYEYGDAPGVPLELEEGDHSWCPLPDSVTGLTAVVDADTIRLAWNAAARADSYIVVVNYNNVSTLLDTVNALTYNYTIGEDSSCYCYSFTVRGYNDCGDGAASSAVSINPYAPDSGFRSKNRNELRGTFRNPLK